MTLSLRNSKNRSFICVRHYPPIFPQSAINLKKLASKPPAPCPFILKSKNKLPQVQILDDKGRDLEKKERNKTRIFFCLTALVSFTSGIIFGYNIGLISKP